MKDLFLYDSLDASPIVFSDRVLYTPTFFTKTALLYLQEIGSLQAKKPHTSSRTRLSSYLFFCVDSGSGELEYQGKRYKLGEGDCVFIDCQLPYSHSTDTDLWSLSWHPAEHPERALKKQNLLPVRNYLEMHYTEKIVLDELADRFFISKFHLSRVFKEQFGVSIHTYVRNLRITKAKQMLRFTDKKLEDIGYRCGLGAPHYFSRIFKQVEGITPSEFREKWGEVGH